MRTAVIVLLALLILVGVGISFRSQLSGTQDRGLHGQDLEIPGDYRLVALGEADLATVAAELSRLLADPGSDARVAASFEADGVAQQVLVDATRELIDVRRISPAGTLVRELWHGPVEPRLARAASEGDFAVPGLPRVERRNLYH